MKCFKCGYISFDNLEKCKSCGYNLKLHKYENSDNRINLKRYKELSKKINRSFKRRFLKKEPQKKVINKFDDHLITHWEPDSVAAEQYRVLRTGILERSKKNGNRVFLITSAVHGEGKTLTSINLAISFAIGLHESALLIDADFRKANVARMCGIRQNTLGLADYLVKEDDLANFIIKTSIPKLNIIPSGKPPNNPAELINSKRMSAMIKEVKDRYNDRFIIIDSPPLIPVADSTILASLADNVIIVIKTSATQRELVNECFKKITKRDKIIGLVLNNCDYSFYKYYDSYYKYSRENIS